MVIALSALRIEQAHAARLKWKVVHSKVLFANLRNNERACTHFTSKTTREGVTYDEGL